MIRNARREISSRIQTVPVIAFAAAVAYAKLIVCALILIPHLHFLLCMICLGIFRKRFAKIVT